MQDLLYDSGKLSEFSETYLFNVFPTFHYHKFSVFLRYDVYSVSLPIPYMAFHFRLAKSDTSAYLAHTAKSQVVRKKLLQLNCHPKPLLLLVEANSLQPLENLKFYPP